MSYSFNVRESDKAHAIEAVRKKMHAIAVGQPAHGKEVLHVIATAKVLIGMLEDDAGRDVFVSMGGGISMAETGVQELSLSIRAHLVKRA